MKMNKIVIFGANGYVGKYLTSYFEKKCENLITVSRKTETPIQKNRTHLVWDGSSSGSWETSMEKADLVINLAGRSVNCRYTEKNKQEILDSRIQSTAIIGTAIQRLKFPPKVWMNMSSATIYRHAEDQHQDEYNGEIKNDFSVQVCKAWEKTFDDFELPFTRKIKLRTAIVLGKTDGAFPRLIRLAKCFLGGKMGSGLQMFSWVHECDMARAIEFLYENNSAAGVYNIATTGAIKNKQLMAVLRQHLKVRAGIPSPVWLLKLGAIIIGTETELILKSRWVYPEKLVRLGFHFKYDTINAACADIFN